MFTNGLQPWHIIVLVIVLIALFGAKRLPAAARGIGQSMRIFKAEAKSMRDGDGAEQSERAEEPVKQQLQQAKQDVTEPKASTAAEQPGSSETPR